MEKQRMLKLAVKIATQRVIKKVWRNSNNEAHRTPRGGDRELRNGMHLQPGWAKSYFAQQVWKRCWAVKRSPTYSTG
jgi:hypothetical protein